VKFYRCFRIRQKGSPKSLYRLVCAVAPGAARADDFEIEARSGETLKLWKIATLVAMCRAFGLHRTPRGEPGTYGLDAARHYEDSDLRESELLLVGPQPKHQINVLRDSQGRLLLDPEFTTGLRLGSVWNLTVVCDEFHEALESGGFLGLQFREAVPRNDSNTRDTFWELESLLVLPKMANTDRLMYCGWRQTPPQPFTGDYSRMVFINDPPYRAGEIHYRRSDLAELGAFDVARTFELYRQPRPELVVSQRFYRFCLRNGISLNIEPVRIDPG
jgi:hypothetical protein